MDAVHGTGLADALWQGGVSSSAASFSDVLREVSGNGAASGVLLVNTPPHPPAPVKVTPGGVEYDGKIQRQMGGRGWTPEQIDAAVRTGQRIDAVNKYTGGAATRYVNPVTGQSVVIDNASNRVLQVGKQGGLYGPDSGDVPGASMRPPPADAAEPPGAGTIPRGSVGLPAPGVPSGSPTAPTPPVQGSPAMPEVQVVPEVPLVPELPIILEILPL